MKLDTRYLGVSNWKSHHKFQNLNEKVGKWLVWAKQVIWKKEKKRTMVNQMIYQ